MIEVSHVSKAYRDGVKALDDVSAMVPSGKVTGVVGFAGSGKTVMLETICGLQAADEGTVVVNGCDIIQAADDAMRQIGYVRRDPGIPPAQTGMGYLRSIADRYGIAAERLDSAIESFGGMLGVLGSLGDPMGSVSREMHKKLRILGEIVHEPHALVVDEPLLRLDREDAERVKRVLRGYADSGHVVLLATNDLEAPLPLCDRMILLYRGEAFFEGSCEDMAARFDGKSLPEIFLLPGSASWMPA